MTALDERRPAAACAGDSPEPVADHLHIPERLIAAPAAGVFRVSAPDVITAEGEVVHAGQRVGMIEVTGGAVAVISPHTGFVMGLLALPGERVRADQPLAWVRVV